MQINRESADQHTIQSYSDTHIIVNHVLYSDSVIVSRQHILSPWPIHSIDALNEEALHPLLASQPEVILIGVTKINMHIPIMTVQYLANQRIGIECMLIGAATRTFNVLLNEQRAVVLGIIRPQEPNNIAPR